MFYNMKNHKNGIIFIFILILAILYFSSGECVIYPFSVNSNAQFDYSICDTWVLYNIDPSLDREALDSVISMYGNETMVDFLIVDITNEKQTDYIEYIPFSVGDYVGVESREYYPFGKSNNTVVIMPIDYKVVNNNIRGGALGKRAFVIFDPYRDTYGALKIRILHEIAHGYSLDADGMFTTQKNEFYGWMVGSGYVFSDFYYNNQNYYTIYKSPKFEHGEKVFIDYLRWLFSKY